MRKVVIDELRLLYGLSEKSDGTFEDAMGVLQIAAAANRAYFVIKVDGECEIRGFS